MKQYFLELLKNECLNKKTEPKTIDFVGLFQLSSQHQVSSLIYNQIYDFDEIIQDLKNYWKRNAIQDTALQTMKTQRFLHLYKTFLNHNLKIIVVKGILCRVLYPHPDARVSNDEDLYIEKQDLNKATDLLVNEGFNIINKSEDVTTFFDLRTGLSLELHTSLFSTDSKTFRQYQNIFKDAFEHVITHRIQDVEIYSLSYDQHLLFLILHFVKHFLHGGVGIRQILDIVMYSKVYNEQIDWNYIKQSCSDLNILKLMQNVFALSHDYFEFDVPVAFKVRNYDYQDLLNDILDAGVFGKSSSERLHSSTMTLNALENGKTNILKSIFPSFKAMKSKYDYLNKYPLLLPVAYVSRINEFLKHHDSKQRMKTVEIGNQRIQLLKKYGVMK